MSKISDHFPIFLISNKINLDTYSENTPSFKRFINEKSISKFKSLVSKVNWNDVNQINSPNYNSFIQKKNVYEKAFPKVKTKIKMKSLLSSRGLLKSSEKKQKGYDKFLKNKTSDEMNEYKTYKNLFETLKLKSKFNFFKLILEENCTFIWPELLANKCQITYMHMK